MSTLAIRTLVRAKRPNHIRKYLPDSVIPQLFIAQQPPSRLLPKILRKIPSRHILNLAQFHGNSHIKRYSATQESPAEAHSSNHSTEINSKFTRNRTIAAPSTPAQTKRKEKSLLSSVHPLTVLHSFSPSGCFLRLERALQGEVSVFAFYDSTVLVYGAIQNSPKSC